MFYFNLDRELYKWGDVVNEFATMGRSYGGEVYSAPYAGGALVSDRPEDPTSVRFIVPLDGKPVEQDNRKLVWFRHRNILDMWAFWRCEEWVVYEPNKFGEEVK